MRVNKANGVASSAKSKKKVLDKVLDEATEKPSVRQPTLTFKSAKTDSALLSFRGCPGSAGTIATLI